MTDIANVFAQMRRLKEQFDAVHAEGMRALEAHDFDAFGSAVDGERQILKEHARLTEGLLDLFPKRP